VEKKFLSPTAAWKALKGVSVEILFSGSGMRGGKPAGPSGDIEPPRFSSQGDRGGSHSLLRGGWLVRVEESAGDLVRTAFVQSVLRPQVLAGDFE